MSLRTLIKSLLRKLGFAIYSIPKFSVVSNEGYTYSQSNPNATLSPWSHDSAFMFAYEKVKNNTLVDVYRLYELWTIVEETSKVGGDIVEIGVWRGGSGCLMAYRDKLLNSDDTIYLCDTFEGVVKASDEDSSYLGGEHKDTDINYVRELSSVLDLTNTEILTGIFPDESGAKLASKRVRLLHVDVDVFKSAKDSVEFLWERMPSGAVIVFDDYGFVGCEGVTRFVDEFSVRSDVLHFYNLNGHALLVKL